MNLLKKKSAIILLFCILWLSLSACGSRTENTISSAAASENTAVPTPTSSPIPSQTPRPTATPTPSPTATPIPVYRDVTEEDYDSIFNEAITKERLAYILQYLPIGSCEDGISAIATKNLWENFYMTDNMSIREVYDPRFENEGRIVSGDASKMFSWFGIVSSKGINNDSTDDGVKIDGNTLTIDNSKCNYKNWCDPQIVMGKISENDLYIYFSYSTEYDVKRPNIYRTAIFQKDDSGKYQVTQIVEREAGSAAPAKPEYNFSFIPENSNGSDEMWETLLSGAGIYEYLPEWTTEDSPTQYAVLDINGDGISELILSSSIDSIGFSTFTVMVLNLETATIKPVMFSDFSETEFPYATCHNGLRYSRQYRSLVYKRMNNGSMFGSYEYHGIQGGQDIVLFSVGFDTMQRYALTRKIIQPERTEKA